MSKLYLPRSKWVTDAYPMTGPIDWDAGGTWVIHYPGSTSAWYPKTRSELIDSIRASHRDYKINRGYSYGYSFVVGQFGLAVEVRGYDIRPASNPGRKLNKGNFNRLSRSIQVAVGLADPAFPAAVAAVNALIATRPNWNVEIHGDVDFTACCGTGLIGQVRNRIIGQGLAGVVPPPPTVAPDPIDQWHADLLATGYNPPGNFWWFPVSATKPRLHRGSPKTVDNMQHTHYLQSVIYYHGGGDITVDGDFGPETERRVRDVQSFFGLQADGIVGMAETWPKAIDYMVTLNEHPPPPPPPSVEPPHTTVRQIDKGRFYVERGDSQWVIGELAYGSGTLGAEMVPSSAFSTFSTPRHPHIIDVPGVKGLVTEVLPGEGPIATLNRMNTDGELDTYYAWNGGDDRVPQPGDTVFMPV